MGEHRTSKSKAVIDAIVRLGEALEYHVRREWEIPGTEPNPERIDIALFIDANATAPAFAVEVDSSDAPASTSNPVKIFGKSTHSLVKPYFVFQVFLEAAATGKRRSNTETLLGTHNFLTYDFGQAGMRQSFVQDLISHHRAIRAGINLYNLGLALDDSTWDAIDRYAILEFASSAMNAGPTELADCAWLSLDAEHFSDALSRRTMCNRDSLGCDDLSFCGNMFRWPLLLGLRAHNSDSKKVAEVFKELQEWQDGIEIIFHPKNSFVGLSPEFDFAIAQLAPPIYCVVAMLFSKSTEAATSICDQLFTRATDGHLNNYWVRYALAWCVIASIKCGAVDISKRSLIEIDNLGGLPEGTFPMLPGVSFYEEEVATWISLLESSSNRPTPSLAEVTTELAELKRPDIAMPHLVARLLVDNEFISEMHRPIISMHI